jgi:transposase
MEVANAAVEIARRPPAEGGAVANDDPGLAPLGARVPASRPALIVLEATGGREVPVTAALAAAGPPGVGVNPRHARDCAKAPGRLAKTEALEAPGLAHVAEAVRPAPRPLPDAPSHVLRAPLARRRPRLDMLPAEKKRLSRAPRRSQADIQAHIAGWERRLADLTAAVNRAIRASPVWRARDDRLQSPPGVGPVLARTLVAALPERGAWSRPQSAALVGVAPRNRESGTLRGQRTVWGGRAHVRAALYMSTLVAVRYNPVLQTFYDRLRRAGKAPKVALTACRRKLLTILNAMVKHRTPWQQNYAPSS